MISMTDVLTVVFLWLLIGMAWVGFYDTVYTFIPANAPIAVSADAEVWNTLLWIWNLGCVILALGTGICVISDGDLTTMVELDIGILVTWIILLITWALLWYPANVLPVSLLPSSSTTVVGGITVSDNIYIYNTGFEFVMLALALVGIVGGGGLSLGGGERKNGRTIDGSGATYNNGEFQGFRYN